MLLRLGIEPTTPHSDPERYAELYRVARRLRDTGHHVVGLVPVNDKVAVPPAAVDLGLSLSAAAAAASVAIVNANPARSYGPVAENEETFAGHAVMRLHDRVHLLTPAEPGRAGAASAARIAEALGAVTERYDYVIADLTGFSATGEHRWAYDLVEAVALVVRSGCVREQELMERHRAIPSEGDLGVLIVG